MYDFTTIDADRIGITEMQIPNFYERINKLHLANQPVRIIIDGLPRTGKSYFAKHLIEQFTKKYITVFTVRQLLSVLKNGISKTWILFDEAELEAPSTEFRSANNLVLRLVISSYGYLNNDLILTTPSILQIDKALRHLITFRITITAKKIKKGIKRIAFVKLPIWLENKQRYGWITAEEHHIPEIAEDKEYENNKRKNFLQALDNWQKKLSTAVEEMQDVRLATKKVLLERHKVKLQLQQQRLAEKLSK